MITNAHRWPRTGTAAIAHNLPQIRGYCPGAGCGGIWTATLPMAARLATGTCDRCAATITVHYERKPKSGSRKRRSR